ncbi:hypothetical protein D3C78_1711020 [compost metagenome]
MATDRQVRLLHQLGQMLCRGAGEVDERHFVDHRFGKPAAERVRAGHGVEETPALARLGVVGTVHFEQQVINGAAIGKL